MGLKVWNIICYAQLDDSFETPDSSPPSTPQGKITPEFLQTLDLNSMNKPFKNKAYTAPKNVKKLKQIATVEKALELPVDFPTCAWTLIV